MNLGGFIGGGCRGGGGGGSGGGSGSGSGDARVVPHTFYINMPTAAMAQPQLVTPPMARPMFNSPPLSLAIKPKMEGFGEMGGLIGENFDLGVMGGAREDEYDGRSGSDNLEGASGDDQDAASDKSSRKKKYHRHTPFQIQELEASFKENPHPDEKARLELGKRLGLEGRQVKFWFQNRRTQMKTHLERHENIILRQENDELRFENITMKEAMRNPICSNCSGPAILGEVSIQENQLRFENARLRDELSRICVLANKFLGRPLSSLSGHMPLAMSSSSLELAVGRSSFGFNSDDPTLPVGFDFGNGIPNALPVMPPGRPAIGMTGIGATFDKSIYLELALAAMDELMRLAQIDNPLWFRSLDGGMDTLNHDEYVRSFPPCMGIKPQGFISEATKATGLIMINSLAFVDALMDVNQWAEMFRCMIGRASLIDIISSGTGGTRNGALQLMYAELQVLSPLVPVRQLRFLRFCKQQGEGVWAIVDVSIEAIRDGSNKHAFTNCRRLPSGCIVQDMPNGYSKVTWVEHSEYEENEIHHLYRPLVRSGMGFGAQRWVVTLQRQCEFVAVMSSTIPSEDHAVVSPAGKRSVAKLAQRMTNSFSAGVCATVHKWEVVQVGNVGEGARLMIRKSIGNPGEPPGLVLSATMSVWMPVSSQRLFDFLRNEQQRSQWDILSHDGPMQQMVQIAKGQDHGNSISLLRSSGTTTNSNQSSMLILQETCTDASGSLMVYAAIDIPSMNVVMSGGDSSCVAFLPSGFSIVPDCFLDSAVPNNCNGTLAKEGSGGGSQGSLLTVGFQILVNSLPAANLTVESVDTVNALISRTLQGIKAALQCN